LEFKAEWGRVQGQKYIFEPRTPCLKLPINRNRKRKISKARKIEKKETERSK